MYRFLLSLAAILAFTSASFAQTKHRALKSSTVLRSTESPAKKAAAGALSQKASLGRSASRPRAKLPAQQKLRAARYGGFLSAPAAPPPPPPTLDTTSPRTLSSMNVTRTRALTVTYWSDGAYRRDALNHLNHFLRDLRENAETEMDPQLFDILWHTQMHVGFPRGRRGALGLSFAHDQCLAGERQPRRGQRQPAHEWQCNGHPHARRAGVPNPAGRTVVSLGGVGFYPRSGFVHIDTGPVRYW